MKHVKPLVNKLINRVSKANKYINQVSTRTPVYLGNNRAITKTVYGHKIIVDTRDLSLSPHILLDGEWESWITKVFLNYVQPGMNVLDIGSNVGYYSLLAAERIGENGSLICFEANPEMSDILFHNLLLNGFSERSKVVTKAVYSHADKLEFKIYDKFKGSSSLWANDKHAANFRDKIKVYEVDAVALDEFLPKNTKIDLIKIDAEGAEPYILKGAKKLITSNPNLKIIMEFAPTVINVSYGSVSNFYQEINDLGMKIYKIMHDSTLELMNLEECENIPGIDVVLKK